MTAEDPHTIEQDPDDTARRSWTERGANLVEYALLMALIAIVCVAGVSALGQTLPDQFSSASSAL